MAYATLSPAEHGLRARLAALLAECGAFLELLGASIRLSRALEHRRAPQGQDLKILGIRGPFPGDRLTRI